MEAVTFPERKILNILTCMHAYKMGQYMCKRKGIISIYVNIINDRVMNSMKLVQDINY